VSLLILAVAITGTALAYPVAIRTQQLSRYQIMAGAKVLELLDSFAQAGHGVASQQTEAEWLGQSTFTASPVDLERSMVKSLFDMLPLPSGIARRIDSDGDEIARLLDDGGCLFYPSPNPHQLGSEARYANITERGDSFTDWSGGTGEGADEAASHVANLVFAVVGCAQQNALPYHPCLAWPYYDWTPAPLQAWEIASWRAHAAANDPDGPWPGLVEAEAVHALVNPDTVQAVVGDLAQVAAYVRAAQALVAATCATVATPGGPQPLPPADLRTLTPPWPAADPDVYPPPWRVLATRVLAHAATMRTNGVLAASAPASAQEIAYAAATHDAALGWATRYAAMDPYDWGAARPLNRQIGWDFPLLQFDCFASPGHPDPIYRVPDGTGDVSWRVVAGRRPRWYPEARGVYATGAAPIPPNRRAIDESWGEASHFNLASRFAAEERARQIVCWAVDWRAYEDCESAPAAPLDARLCHIDSRGNQVTLAPVVAHPEHHLFWADAARASFPAPYVFGAVESGIETVAYKQLRLGWWGADRDGDKSFDQGPLPATARLRAATVARFVFYDRRVPHALRN